MPVLCVSAGDRSIAAGGDYRARSPPASGGRPRMRRWSATLSCAGARPPTSRWSPCTMHVSASPISTPPHRAQSKRASEVRGAGPDRFMRGSRVPAHRSTRQSRASWPRATTVADAMNVGHLTIRPGHNSPARRWRRVLSSGQQPGRAARRASGAWRSGRPVGATSAMTRSVEAASRRGQGCSRGHVDQGRIMAETDGGALEGGLAVGGPVFGPGEAARCVHRWMLQTPSGGVTSAACGLCGQTRTYNDGAATHWTLRGRTPKRPA